MLYFTYYYIMVGFGFVTFDTSEAVEEACRKHYHEISGKTVQLQFKLLFVVY